MSWRSQKDGQPCPCLLFIIDGLCTLHQPYGSRLFASHGSPYAPRDALAVMSQAQAALASHPFKPFCQIFCTSVVPKRFGVAASPQSRRCDTRAAQVDFDTDSFLFSVWEALTPFPVTAQPSPAQPSNPGFQSLVALTDDARDARPCSWVPRFEPHHGALGRWEAGGVDP
ncbi:uncharacterized protein K460DRAFT_391965 [Cucurbitaria berberidis CBS 394.84]|uniref:Uncharacterized protein n=1 Tax=Cucurbitaria berberidis CBS 394.84 TaxID=1168544 RepID=A0A9P4GUH0_9PLEO|nr:uncharacterized protein K460DRAFT_391965 [Cucurbitaria berberidis CBS 394.84]KAF1851744.1 hypothetical protein K460DRAFT_391965 [Cucurbitaria berberidis CBS 394.84]